jgi:DNA-binding GntR family transcriptional regulator
MISVRQQRAPGYSQQNADAATRRARNLRGLLTNSVRESIMRGDYPPGSPLGEMELAQRFGVSRGPVREALIQLEREYLVRSFPNRGCFVTTLSEQEFDEIVRLRFVLEPIALQHARDRASLKDIAEMRRRLRDLEGLAAKRDQRAYIGKDYAFHVAIWELSGQPLLTEVLKRITAPVFVFEAIVEKRYVDADYDSIADARAHRIIVDYLARKTTRNAHACLQPVLDVAMHAEKPIVFGRHFAREPAANSSTARVHLRRRRSSGALRYPVRPS